MGFDFADVDGEHLSGFGTFNVGAARRCVASVGGLGVGTIGVVKVSDVVWDEFGVWTAVHLSLDLEPFARFDAEGDGVGGGVFVVEGVSGCGLHLFVSARKGFDLGEV